MSPSSCCRVGVVELRRGSADVVEFVGWYLVVIRWSSSADSVSKSVLTARDEPPVACCAVLRCAAAATGVVAVWCRS